MPFLRRFEDFIPEGPDALRLEQFSSAAERSAPLLMTV
jgi:hypothetical protein